MSECFVVPFPVHPWLRDHHFAGQAVLPMVTAIDFLAALILEKFHEIDATRLENAIFPKLLILPKDDSLTVLVELERLNDQRLHAAMWTKKSSAISRLLCHAEMIFGSPARAAAIEIPFPVDNGPSRAIACEKIYAELVPFGVKFQTLHGEVHLQGETASGTLIAPDLPFFCPALPNPFLLDGAMHAACVHGQCFCGFVPFPTGFSAMKVENAHRLQTPGCTYRSLCRLTAQTTTELRYDLRVDGDGGTIQVAGLVMRDVSGGTIKPPPWIKQVA
ncbi:MAG: polyketide synthase dehydratase domain-containing protein [Desulfobulbaceae bacterium]|jgi:hypothetical protein|nr:polyketide synthase dehydratase domain-containing protein [Desulfobulbaceae bacterium]